jgi:gliding motility-associated lipoprotein GldD
MKIKKDCILYFLIFVLLVFIGCAEENMQTPKPRMYPKVIYPEKTYQDFDSTFCNFKFKFPNYSEIVQDSFVFEGKPSGACWFDIKNKDLNTSLHCSYYHISKDKDLSTLINDAFNIAGKHNIKANYRKETTIVNKYGVKGILFDIEGPVASPTQFYLTDEKNHFFRASLYFNSKVNADSTAPILKFVKQDIDTLIASFSWK